MRRLPGTILLAAFLAIMIAPGCDTAPPKIAIENPHAELSPLIYGEGMITLTIVNQGGPDVLTGLSVDIPGAQAVLHTMDGRRMVKAGSMKIPSRQSLVMRAGSSHIMLENMPRTIAEGTPFTLTLTFQRSATMQVPLTMQKPPAPAAAGS
ncbi:MAG: copper chaperone PCu(A)C [Nitrospiraceae bacterium]|nr:copper chaperone PCu(A)C [Nitrospiraceae bacterium]